MNNISVSRQWNPNDAYTTEYHGSLTALDWTGIKFSKFFDEVSVDFSTATTFIPFFGLLLITVGFKKIINAKEGEQFPDYFPFFRSFNAAVIALGLIGTVWGLIMIGYGNLENFDLARLTNALHTSLFSTLIALVWVFILVNPVSKFMQWLWYSYTGQQVIRPTSENIHKEMSRFINNLDAASKEVVQFSNSLDNEVFSLLEDNITKLTGISEKIEEVVEQQKCLIEKQNKYQEYQKNIFEKIIERLKKDEQKVSFMESGIRNTAKYFLKFLSARDNKIE